MTSTAKSKSPDYTEAPFYAIGGPGYGKGFTEEEAVANYVAAVTRGVSVKNTAFKSKAEMTAYFTAGGGAPITWRPPVGTVGFVLGPVPGHGTVPQWEDGNGNYSVSTEEQVVTNPHRKG